MTATTATASAPVATADVTDVPTADAFRAAIAAASVAGDAGTQATATLAAIALARYTVHAARYVTKHDGVDVLPESDRKNVSALVWLEATGSITAPSAKDRTPGETSLGQYVSRMGTVATNLDYGMTWLAGVDSLTLAYTEIGEASRDAKQAKEDRAFTVWVGMLAPADREAFDFVTNAILAGDGGEHRAAFIRSVTPSTK